jgi:phosphate-selective porin OprO/OprP
MGCFDRVRPYENFFRVRDESGCVQTGRGAWEVAYRYSYLDLADSLTASGNGTCSDHTLALNWYLNPFTRLMLNYVLSDVDRFGANNTFRPDGLIHTFQTRVAIDF